MKYNDGKDVRPHRGLNLGPLSVEFWFFTNKIQRFCQELNQEPMVQHSEFSAHSPHLHQYTLDYRKKPVFFSFLVCIVKKIETFIMLSLL